MSKVVIHIKKNTTGVIRKHVYEVDDQYDDMQGFMWNDGNYACDCNRELFYERSEDPDYDADTKCGKTRFSVVFATVAGKRLMVKR